MLNFLNSTVKFFKQRKNHRNRKTLRDLKRRGWPMPKIRRALIELNDLNIIILADRKVSNPTMYGTINGDKNNIESQHIFARSLGLTREELFPPVQSNRV